MNVIVRPLGRNQIIVSPTSSESVMLMWIAQSAKNRTGVWLVMTTCRIPLLLSVQELKKVLKDILKVQVTCTNFENCGTVGKTTFYEFQISHISWLKVRLMSWLLWIWTMLQLVNHKLKGVITTLRNYLKTKK